MTNKLEVVGNLAADPEIRYTPQGKAVTEFSVADTPRRLNQASGQWEEGETNWFRVTIWDQYAQNVAASLKKGDQVIVTGRITTDRFTDKNNETRTAQKVLADHVAPTLRFATARIEKVRSGNNGGGQVAQGGNNAPVAPPMDDDTPF